LVVRLSNAGVRFAGMIQESAGSVSRIEIRFRAEPKTVVGERSASIPQDAGVDDTSGDLYDRLCAAKILGRDESESIADVGNDNRAK
jgi:hypothetical protein